MRDDERGEPDQRTSLVPADAKPRRGRPRLPWPRKGGTSAAEDGELGVRGEDAADAEEKPALKQRGNGRVRAFLSFVADRVIETAPRVPVRDLATLRAQFPGLGPEEI